MITEDELRQALSEIAAEADTDTARDDRSQDLIDITAPEIATPERRHRTWWIPAAAAVVAAIMISLVIFAGRGGSKSTRPAPIGPATQSPATIAKPLVGTAWRLSKVHSAHKAFLLRGHPTWVLPAHLIYGLAFGPDGRLNGRLGVPAFTGSYRTSGNRITLRGVPTDGFVNDPAEQAMRRVFPPTSSHLDSVIPRFTLSPSTLTVRSRGWTLSFRPLGATDSYCLDTPPRRAGTAKRLIPGGPSAVTICPLFRSAKTVTDIADLVRALDALPTSPPSRGCVPRGPSASFDVGSYDLYFHYQSGPDVLVNVWAQCKFRPSINNLRLQAAFSPRTILPLIRAALRGS